jgi:hypothetical protein
LDGSEVIMVQMWLAVVLAVWAVLSNALALWFAREMWAARRHARIAMNMAADAVEARVEMEQNTPVMVLMGPDGSSSATAPVRRVRYWLN